MKSVGTNVVERIERFNRDRDPRLVARKYAAMRTDAFAFYRGTCHLFFEDWPKRSALDEAPQAWISGDLHPENFGSFRGGDGQVYFDINDFDEAALAPCTWDVTRCLTGILIGARSIGILDEDARELSRRYLYAYRACLGDAAPQAVTADESSGMVRDLLVQVRARSPDDLARARSAVSGKKRRIIVDGVHAIGLPKERRKEAKRLFNGWNGALRKSGRYELLDVALRIAGIGSLGVPRFVALAVRKRELCLLDVKCAAPTSLRPFLKGAQPLWRSEADRIVFAQGTAQHEPPSPLEAIRDGSESFSIKELQPTEDRVRWKHWHGKLERLEHLSSTMGQVTAWSHLRGAGVKKAATRSALASYGREGTWPSLAAAYAIAYAAQVERDFDAYRVAYDAKRLAH
jgi:uncharacterized protein (DUF2252 family)